MIDVKITVVPYTFHYRYNPFDNAIYVSVFKGRKCIISSRKLIHGIWPLAGGMVQDVDYSKLAPNAPKDVFINSISIRFYKAFRSRH